MRLRGLFASLNFLATLLFLGVLFIMVNYIATRRYAQWDLSRQQLTVLSDQTKQTLATLHEPCAVVVFYQPSHRLYDLIKDLLQEYVRLNPNLTIEYVDPEQDVARAKRLAKEFHIQDLNVVVFSVHGRHKYLSDTELADYDYSAMALGGEPRVKAFKGEAAFTSAILSLTQATQPLVWVTTGHGEKSVEDTDTMGFADVKKALEQQNMVVQPATLLDRTEIPDAVKLVVIAGPTRRFTDDELVLLASYLQRGGRLLALIDPLEDSGLDGLLERWGVALGLDIVVDPSRQLPMVSAGNLFITAYTSHPIVKKMKTFMTLFPLARSVVPVTPPPRGLTVTPLALTSAKGWGETKTSVEQFQFNAGEDLKGPVSIAVAVERPAPPTNVQTQAGPAPKPTRLVVIGDSDFLVNGQVGNVGNRDLLLGAVFWLVEQEHLIGIGPKTLEALKLHLTGPQLSNVFWLSFLGLPGLFGLLGVGVWLLRRR